MRRIIGGCAVAAWLGSGIVGPALGQDLSLPTTGQPVSGHIELFGKRIPLPPGPWQVMSAGYGQVSDVQPGPYGTIGGVLLTRQDKRDGGEYLLIHTNALPTRDGWGLPLECGSDRALFSSVAEQRNRHSGCSFVIATRRPWLLQSGLPALGTPPSVVRIAGPPEAGSTLQALPDWALVAGLRVSDRRDVLDIRYGVAPDGPNAAGWFVPAAELSGSHRAVVAQLGEWAQQVRQTAIASLRVPAEQVAPVPDPWPHGKTQGVNGSGEQISAVRLAAYKLATYRVMSSTRVALVSYALTGDWYTSLVMTFWQGFTHSGIYLTNELLWEWPAQPPTMRFAAAPLAPGANRATAIATASRAPADMAQDAGKPVPVVDGKHVPLPEGQWNEIARRTSPGVTETAFAQIDGGRLRGLVIVHTNPAPTATIAGTSDECGRTDIGFAVIRYDTPDDGFCTYGKHVRPAQPSEGEVLWARIAARLAADGVTTPPRMAMTGARARTRQNFLDVRYYFAADQDAADSMAAMREWSDLVQEPLELGVRGRLPASLAVLPSPWRTDAVGEALAAETPIRLAQLATAGAMDEAVLRAQLGMAEAAAAEREQQRWSLWTRSAYKVVTYRMAAYIDGVVVAWLVTADPALGLAFSTINTFITPVLLYANEIGWAAAGVGGKAPASLQPLNFPEIGPDEA